MAAGVGTAAGAVIVFRSGPGGAEYAGGGVAEVVGESIGSAANTGSISASETWVVGLWSTSLSPCPPRLVVFSGGSSVQPVVFSRCLMTRS